jgi:exonuclease SbcC
MIPLSLTVSGFLSYRDPVNLDLSSVELACISGPNGAGKSSLLDAITWALFGIARKRDEALVNTQSNAAEVSLVFAYEGNIYRVQRTLPRGKTTAKFQIWQSIIDMAIGSFNRQPQPETLTERTTNTQAIQRTLRMDYDNCQCFLLPAGQGRLFTQQRPGDRNRNLASILGLEVWEVYRQRAADRRKSLEAEIAALEGRLSEIVAELDEEKIRKARLKELQAELEGLAKSRTVQEAALEGMHAIAASLFERRKMVEALSRQAEASRRQLAEQQNRLDARLQERLSFQQT